MTEEQLEKGKQLLPRIKETKKHLEDLLKSTGIEKGGIIRLEDATRIYAIPSNYLDFETIKALMEARIRKELTELEEQFKQL